jgi:hypothetical protein
MENMDVGTISEQLREAKRERDMWRERAEAAEKRAATFEGFIAKLRESHGKRQDVATELSERTVEVEGHVQGLSETSKSSGRTEDAGIVSARIKKCLHGKADGPRWSDRDGSLASESRSKWSGPAPEGFAPLEDNWIASQGFY